MQRFVNKITFFYILFVLKPFGLSFCHRQESSHILSRSYFVSKPRTTLALAGSAYTVARSPARIYSTSGVMYGSVRGNVISTSGLTAGIYLLRVDTADGSKTMRFVKK